MQFTLSVVNRWKVTMSSERTKRLETGKRSNSQSIPNLVNVWWLNWSQEANVAHNNVEKNVCGVFICVFVAKSCGWR